MVRRVVRTDIGDGVAIFGTPEACKRAVALEDSALGAVLRQI